MGKAIDLALGTKICRMDPDDYGDRLIDIIASANQLAGQTMLAEDQYSFCRLLEPILLSTYPEITIEEVAESVKKGILGEYGEYFGINTKSFMQFICGYLLSGERKAAIEKFRKAAIERKEEAPRKMTVGDYKRAILNDIRLFNEGNDNLIVFDVKRYLCLVKWRVMPGVGGAKWSQWVSRAKEYIQNVNYSRAERIGSKDMMESIANLTQNFEAGEVTRDEAKKIVFTARKLRYLAWLEYLKKEQISNPFE